MPSTNLTQRRVEAARPKIKAYSLHDSKDQGLSLTVTPMEFHELVDGMHITR